MVVTICLYVFITYFVGYSVKDMKKNDQIVIGDFNKISLLPKPKTVLFPYENVQLGWQYRKMTIGSGLDNSGVICYINSTLQVYVKN